MPNNEAQIEEPDVSDVILTEEGAFTPEEFAAREAAGIAAPVVSESELLRLGRKQTIAKVADAPITTFLERGASAASFGLTDLLASEEQRLESALRAEVSPTAALAGEVVGSVAPALLSGGTGAVGTFARMTPAGRLSAATARLARGGATTASRIARGATAGAIEGAVQGAGNLISEAALNEDVDFSADALLSNVGVGALIGGGTGGLISGLQKAGGRVAQDLLSPDEAVAVGLKPLSKKAVKGVKTTPLKGSKLFGKARKLKGQARKELGDFDGLDKIVSARMRKEAPDAYQRLALHIDDSVTDAATAAKRVDDLLADPAVISALGQGGGGVRSRLASLVEEYTDDAARAKEWGTRYAEKLGVDDLADVTPKKFAEQLDNALDDEGAIALAALDESRAKLDNVLADLDSFKPKPIDAATAADVVALPGVEAAEQVAKRPGVLTDVAELAQKGLGAVELGGQFGIGEGLGIRDLPLVGEAASLYLKFKAGAGMLKGVSSRSTKLSDAASRVNSTRDAIVERVKKPLKRGLKGVLESGRTVAIPSRVAAQVATLSDREPATTRAEVAASLEGTSPAVQEATATSAERAHAYLLDNAPSNPMRNTPFSDLWQPSEQQSREFTRRVDAVNDPIGALDEILNTPSAPIETEVLRTVYPGLYREIQGELMANTAELEKNFSHERLNSIGRAFQIPLTISLVDGYNANTVVTPVAETAPAFQTPSVARQSAFVQTELSREDRHNMR